MNMNQLLKKVQLLEKQLAQAEDDKVELSNSIENLNQCYLVKISLMEQTIKGYEARCEQLLQWKKQYIDKQLQGMNRYEEQNKKLISIVDELYSKFEEETTKLQQENKRKDQQIQKLKEEKEELLLKGAQNEQKVQELLKDHMKEIQLLKTELFQLKEEYQPSSSEYIDEQVVETVYEEEKNEEESILKEIKANNRFLQEEDSQTRIKIISSQRVEVNFGENNENIV